MRKLLFIAAVAAVAMAGSVSAASAVTISPGGAMTAISNGALIFNGPAGITTSCVIHLAGSFNAGTIGIGGQAASISGNRFSSCTVTTTGLANPAWRLIVDSSYSGTSFRGTLDFSYSMSILGTVCLYGGTLPVTISQSSGVSNTITVGANSLPRSSGSSALCGVSSLNAGSSFTSTPAQTLS